MIRWLLLLLLLSGVLVSAVGVVLLKHESRHAFTTLQAAERDRDDSNVEWSRLQLEQAWLGDAGRIEQKATDELRMERPERVRVIVSQ